MIKRFHKRQENNTVFYRTNERIHASQLRVLDSEGKQLGVLTRQEALLKAQELQLDLVEIAPAAIPPVAKIVDYKKFLYQQAKKKQEEKRNAKTTETKEVRLGPFMDDHDLQIAANRASGFLEDGNKVRFVVKFRGRQITRPEFGYEVIRKITGMLSNVSKLDKDPKLEGKQMIAILAPGKAQVPGNSTEATDETRPENPQPTA